MKRLTLLVLILTISNVAFSQKMDLSDHPPIWNGKSLINKVAYMFPFKDASQQLDKAVILFERDNSNSIKMWYKVSLSCTIDDLYMKGSPEMLVKLGNGKVLKGEKSNMSSGILGAQYVYEVFFNIDKEIQNQILKYDIEKVRFAYVFSFMGITENQILDAYSKDCVISGLNAKIFLNQILNADLSKAKKAAEKRSLEHGF